MTNLMHPPLTPLTHPSAGQLMSVEQTAALIKSGRYAGIAGDETALRRLPAGNWLGGTIPYFMGQVGGVTTRDLLFVTEIPVSAAVPEIRLYDKTELQRVCVDGPENGYSLIIIPAFSDAHSLLARNAPNFEEMYEKPLAGWISGLHLDDLGKRSPLAVNGKTLTFDAERAVVMHVPLPAEQYAQIDIINLFKQGDGDSIRFPQTGFSAGQCTINGVSTNFADYLLARKIDTRLPLVADYCGASVNVSFKGIDQEKHSVDFYAPVFDDIEYKIAAPVPSYLQAFQAVLPADANSAAFCCNCVLNYLYAELEGQRTGALTGPMTSVKSPINW